MRRLAPDTWCIETNLRPRIASIQRRDLVPGGHGGEGRRQRL
jgi:hypothetical protein